jgi:hypothetical protein
MSEQKFYQCEKCRGQQEIPAGDKVPECCGQPMKETSLPLDQCTAPASAEHARMDEIEDACDDGRAGS